MLAGCPRSHRRPRPTRGRRAPRRRHLFQARPNRPPKRLRDRMLLRRLLHHRQRRRRPRIRMPRRKPRHLQLRHRRHPLVRQRRRLARHLLRLKRHLRPPKGRPRCQRPRPPPLRRIKLSLLCHRALQVGAMAQGNRCPDSGHQVHQVIRVQANRSRPELLRSRCLQDLEVLLLADPEPLPQWRADPAPCLLTGHLEALP